MANVRAFRSGNWSDTNPATSPWGTGGGLYAPDASDGVYSNTFTIHVDTNVTVTSVTNAAATSRLWKDGATTTAAAGGTFNLLNGVVIATTVNGPATNAGIETVGLSGANSATIVGVINGPASGATNQPSSVRNTGGGVLMINGSIISGATGATNNAVGNTSSGVINFTGTVAGSNTAVQIGINNSSVGTVVVIGTVIGGTGSSTSYGINNSSTGTAIVVGNVTATSATNAFVSSNASAINKISGNIINHPNGTAAIYAPHYVVDPIPQNSFIQYSNVNQFSTDSLSAFSMPPVSAVRFGTSFANGTLTGTCKVPSQNSVNVGVPVDNTVGTAFLNPASLFDTSIASLTSSNTLGARLKNSATVQSVGDIIASFSN
jgi:hypothetical protein